MLNQIILVGRLVEDLSVKRLEEGKKVGELILAVQREFKNMDGQYDTDFIKCVCWDHLADSIEPFCKKGSLIAVKGRLQIKKTVVGETKLNMLELIAMRVIYLSLNKISAPDIEGSE